MNKMNPSGIQFRDDKDSSGLISMQLNELNEKLQGIIFNADDLFSVISSRIKIFNSGSKQITSSSLKIAESIASEKYRLNVDALNKDISRILRYVDETGVKFNNSEKLLTEVIDYLDIISTEVGDFRKLVKHLEVQAISVRIESARLGNDDKGFSILAENINKLAGIISSKSAAYKEKSRSLTSTISNSLQYIRTLQKGLEINSCIINKNSAEAVSSLLDKYSNSPEKSLTIQKLAVEISGRISSIVTSVQFHDITRQQLQSVIGMIEEINKNIASTSPGSEINENRLAGYIYKAAGLQAEQLNNAKVQLDKAIEEIINSLEAIHQQISSISAAIGELMADHDDAGNEFIFRINEEIKVTVDSFIQNSEMGRDFSSSIKNVIEIIDELAGFVNEIDGIGSEIELISLNANIKAAHTGREGAALGILAEATQRLSSDSRVQTGSVIEKLIRVKEISNGLYTVNDSREEDILQNLHGELNNSIVSLNGIATLAMKDLKSVRESVTEIGNQISESIDLFVSYSAITEKIDGTIKEFINIAEKMKEHAGDLPAGEQHLDKFNSLYTMQVQREIHKRVTDKDYMEQGSVSSQDSEREFDDNIELF